MKKYTDEELEEKIKNLNMFFGKGTEVEQAVEKYIKFVCENGIKTPKDFENLSDEEKETHFYEDFLTEIENNVPEDKFVYFMEKLNFNAFYQLLNEENLKRYPELLAVGLNKVKQASKEYNEEEKIICEMLWREVVNANAIDAITNNIEKIEDYFGDIADAKWEYLFVDNIWSRLDEAHQEQKMNSLIKHIDTKRKNENCFVSKDEKIVRFFYGTHVEVLRKNQSVDDIMNRLFNRENSYVTKKVDPLDYFSDEDEIKYDRHNLIDIIPILFEDAKEEEQEKLLKDVKKNMFFFNSYQPDFMLEILNNLQGPILEREINSLLKIVDLNTTDNNRSYVEEQLVCIYKYLGEDRKLDSISVERFDSIFNKMPAEPLSLEGEKKFKCYAEYVLENDKYAITNNDFVSHLYQALKTNKLELSGFSKEQILEIENVFKVVEKEEMPDMAKYDKYVKNLSDMSDSEFDDFIGDLKKIKNQQLRMPEEYCDYLIKQKLNSNSYLNRNIDEFFPIFKRAFEDKTYYVLKENNMEKDYFINVSNSKDKSVYGEQDRNGIINFQEEEVKNLSEKNLHMINTMFHECRHAVQFMHLEKHYPYNAKEYTMIKEEIIREKNQDFYKKNYKFMFVEIDARIAGAKGQYKYLKKLGFSEKEIIEMDNDGFLECYKAKQIEELKKYDLNEHTKSFEGSNRFVNEIFSEILKDNLYILKEYPVLLLEFKNNGERKPRTEILKAYEQAIDSVRKDKTTAVSSGIRLFPTILSDHSGFNPSTFMQEIDDLQDYEPSNNVIKRYVDDIVEYGALSLFEKSKGSRKIELSPDETEQQKEENFKALVSKLNSFSRNHPNQKINGKVLTAIESYIENENEISNEILSLERIDKAVTPMQRNEANTIMDFGEKSDIDDSANTKNYFDEKE